MSTDIKAYGMASTIVVVLFEFAYTVVGRIEEGWGRGEQALLEWEGWYIAGLGWQGGILYSIPPILRQ